MKRWPGYRMRILLLALLLALGMSSSFVQGSLMAMELAVSAEAGHLGPSGCDGCSGGYDVDPEASTCMSVCGSTAQALLPGVSVALPSASRATFHAARLVLGGHADSPDHGPPRNFTLG